MLEGSSKFFRWKIVRDIYWVWCCGPPKVRHFLGDNSRRLAVNNLVFAISNQLRCNSSGWNGTVTRRVSWPASMVVQSTPCFSTRVWEVNASTCLGLSISSLPIKLSKQSCSSQTWVVSLRRLQEGFIEEFTFCIPTRNIVISILAWDSLFGCFLNCVTEFLVSRIHIKWIRRQQSLCEFIRQSNVVTLFGLVEVPSLNRHAWHCHSKPLWCNKRGSMLWPGELFKDTVYPVSDCLTLKKKMCRCKTFSGPPFQHYLYLNGSVALCYMFWGIGNLFKRSVDLFIKLSQLLYLKLYFNQTLCIFHTLFTNIYWSFIIWILIISWRLQPAENILMIKHLVNWFILLKQRCLACLFLGKTTNYTVRVYFFAISDSSLLGDPDPR